MSGPDAEGLEAIDLRVVEAYDAVAEPYRVATVDELEFKPLDRALLDAVVAICADSAATTGTHAAPILDVGCGPGHIMKHLHDLGVTVHGVDLSPGMVALARSVVPGLDVQIGSVLNLPYPDCTFIGVLSLYSIIHLSPKRIPAAVAELHRVLMPGGMLLLAFHVGDRAVHVDELFGSPVDLDGFLFDAAAITQNVITAGFEIEARLDRRPHADLELDTDRTYLVARKPRRAEQRPH